MGTKRHPGKFDCYVKADPDEPLFTLLARDVMAPALIDLWADVREINGADAEKVAEARECAAAMRKWQARYGVKLDKGKGSLVARIEALEAHVEAETELRRERQERE